MSGPRGSSVRILRPLLLAALSGLVGFVLFDLVVLYLARTRLERAGVSVGCRWAYAWPSGRVRISGLTLTSNTRRAWKLFSEDAELQLDWLPFLKGRTFLATAALRGVSASGDNGMSFTGSVRVRALTVNGASDREHLSGEAISLALDGLVVGDMHVRAPFAAELNAVSVTRNRVRAESAELHAKGVTVDGVLGQSLRVESGTIRARELGVDLSSDYGLVGRAEMSARVTPLEAAWRASEPLQIEGRMTMRNAELQDGSRASIRSSAAVAFGEVRCPSGFSLEVTFGAPPRVRAAAEIPRLFWGSAWTLEGVSLHVEGNSDAVLEASAARGAAQGIDSVRVRGAARSAAWESGEINARAAAIGELSLRRQDGSGRFDDGKLELSDLQLTRARDGAKAFIRSAELEDTSGAPLDGQVAARGELSAHGERLSSLLSIFELGSVEPLFPPRELDQEFVVHGRFQRDARRVLVTDVTLTSGRVSAEGAVSRSASNVSAALLVSRGKAALGVQLGPSGPRLALSADRSWLAERIAELD